MSLLDTADTFLRQAGAIVPQRTRIRKLRLYCEGLKAKALQADFALAELKALENQTDASTTTDPDQPTVQARVEFFCDSFWAFLYSCLDVLAQVANQAMKLGFDEREVSFKKVRDRLDSRKPGSPEQKAFNACAACNAFKNLDHYRNCSLHRRQIYVKTEVKLVQHSAGYQTTTSGNDVSVERTLCDNPLDTTPRTDQDRRIPEYLDGTRNKIFEHIEDILNSTTAVP